MFLFFKVRFGGVGNAAPEIKNPSPNKRRVFKEKVVIAPQTFKRGMTNAYKRSGKRQDFQKNWNKNYLEKKVRPKTSDSNNRRVQQAKMKISQRGQGEVGLR